MMQTLLAIHVYATACAFVGFVASAVHSNLQSDSDFSDASWWKVIGNSLAVILGSLILSAMWPIALAVYLEEQGDAP